MAFLEQGIDVFEMATNSNIMLDWNKDNDMVCVSINNDTFEESHEVWMHKTSLLVLSNLIDIHLKDRGERVLSLDDAVKDRDSTNVGRMVWVDEQPVDLFTCPVERVHL